VARRGVPSTTRAVSTQIRLDISCRSIIARDPLSCCSEHGSQHEIVCQATRTSQACAQRAPKVQHESSKCLGAESSPPKPPASTSHARPSHRRMHRTNDEAYSAGRRSRSAWTRQAHAARTEILRSDNQSISQAMTYSGLAGNNA
jgi:hypothetical protein